MRSVEKLSISQSKQAILAQQIKKLINFPLLRLLGRIGTGENDPCWGIFSENYRGGLCMSNL
jgi:hypothetical protein